MSENKGPAKIKNVTLNVVYSVLLFMALFCVGIAMVVACASYDNSFKDEVVVIIQKEMYGTVRRYMA
jgi:hypothetical protein